jgi:hypothetical protein
MNDPNTQPTIQNRLDTGELTFVSNLLEDEARAKLAATPGAAPISLAENPEQVLNRLREQYGEDAVVTGEAFDAESEKASGVPDMIGVYVTTTALSEAQRAHATQ